MYTVRIGERDYPVNDLPTLQAMMQAGRVNAATWVYDHAAGNWRAAGEILAATPPVGPPSAAPITPMPGGPSISPTAFAPGVQKTTPTMAVLSLIFSIVGVFTCIVLGIVGLILGYKARRQIDDNPQLFQGRGLAIAGIIIGWAQIAMLPFIFGIMAAIAIPNFMSLRTQAYNASAASAGRYATNAQELEYQNTISPDTGKGKYTGNLEALLVWDRALTDDPQVTFTFGPCTTEGFTFTTTHARGDQPFEYTD
ncbi:MAG TPA: DUF4190 domain-containing protein [bacterium]|nr:DUF4190 domain-containing protein [bacterium]